MRYKRVLDPRLLPYLRPGGQLGFLGGDYRTLWDSNTDPYALDCQIRENNTLMYYHGTTCLMAVVLSPDRGTIRFSADKYYASLSHANGLFGTDWPISGDPKLQRTCQEYIAAAVTSAGARHYESQKEGYWQNRLCVSFGIDWTPDRKWLVIDREAVIGFADRRTRDDYHQQYCDKYRRHCDHGDWSVPGRFGNELDLLAIGPGHELVCIEMKHGGNTKGVYYGPVQASVYRDSWEGALSAVQSDLIKMVKQKIDIGLIPASACSRVPNGFPNVIGVLAVAGPEISVECQRRLDQMQAGLRQDPSVKPIQVIRL